MSSFLFVNRVKKVLKPHVAPERTYLRVKRSTWAYMDRFISDSTEEMVISLEGGVGPPDEALDDRLQSLSHLGAPVGTPSVHLMRKTKFKKLYQDTVNRNQVYRVDKVSFEKVWMYMNLLCMERILQMIKAMQQLGMNSFSEKHYLTRIKLSTSLDLS